MSVACMANTLITLFSLSSWKFVNFIDLLKIPFDCIDILYYFSVSLISVFFNISSLLLALGLICSISNFLNRKHRLLISCLLFLLLIVFNVVCSHV